MALRRALVVALSGAVLLPLGPTACSALGSKRLDYVVDGPLTTYNTNTVAGAASAGAQAFARTLTGFSYHGPNGQVVADYDFGTVAEVGRAPLILDYTIDEDAVYSDGVPITCDDMVLTWAAQSGRFPAFDAANRAGYADIVRVDCEPGTNTAQVHFGENRNFADYDELFTATSILPSHVIADQMDLTTDELTATLLGEDSPVVDEIAQVWNTTWDLHPGIDPDHFPSSGPYRIDSVRDDGAVVLVANDRWWKIAPVTKQITVSAKGSDIQDRVDNRDIDVLDIAAGSAGPLTTPDNYRELDTPSDGIEQLIFAPSGPLAAPEARRAVALCTPRDVIAANAGVPVANARLQTTLDDALSGAEGASEAGEFTVANPDAARAELGGAPLAVRIGYRGPNPRLAVVVEEIATACGPAGITVTDAAGMDMGARSLRDGDIDILIASLGGASGSGSSGSPGVDSYSLHTGNGNNLSGYANGQIDFIIGALAVVVSPAERVRLLAEAAPVLWADMPTLPLYRQQRTVLTAQKMDGVAANPTRWGAGWNMDRWALKR